MLISDWLIWNKECIKEIKTINMSVLVVVKEELSSLFSIFLCWQTQNIQTIKWISGVARALAALCGPWVCCRSPLSTWIILPTFNEGNLSVFSTPEETKLHVLPTPKKEKSTCYPPQRSKTQSVIHPKERKLYVLPTPTERKLCVLPTPKERKLNKQSESSPPLVLA